MPHIINKLPGQTSFEAMEELRRACPELKDEKLTYAGILDPLAEGVLVVLSGEERYQKNSYTSLQKEYEMSILFGISSDTHDVLGLINNSRVSASISVDDIKRSVGNLPGVFLQAYPPYSSVKKDGKHLFEWARSGLLQERDIPIRKRCIYEAHMLDVEELSKEKLKEVVFHKISSVRGDFRQTEIYERWRNFFEDARCCEAFSIARVRITCSSGTYMRKVAHDMGKRLNTQALALHIKRTRVGEFSLSDAVKFLPHGEK